MVNRCGRLQVHKAAELLAAWASLSAIEKREFLSSVSRDVREGLPEKRPAPAPLIPEAIL